MKFQAPVASFIKPLQQLSAVAGGASNADDIAHNLLISVKDNNLFLRATDYRVELSFTTQVSMQSEGQTTVNAQKLREACARLDQSAIAMFSYDEMEEVLTIESGSTVFKVRTRNPADFPLMDQEDVEKSLVIQAQQLRKLIENSTFCISNEDFREYLRGMRFEVEGENLSVFTSDGHRMSINETTLPQPLDGSFGVTLIKPCATELLKTLQNSVGDDELVTLAFSKNLLTTTINNYRLTSKLLICPYPNVRAVIPRQLTVSIPVNRSLLKQSIMRVSVLSSKRVNGITLNFAPGFLSLSSENSEHETASDKISLDYAGEPFEISLNASYVLDVLNVLSQSEIVMFNFVSTTQLASTMVIPQKEDESGVRVSYFIARVVV